MALVLTRRPEESIDFINNKTGEQFTVKLIHINGNQARLGIEAPKNITVLRSEINPANQHKEG